MKVSYFKEYGLSEEIAESLKLLGYETPTQIQMEVIPAVLEGLEVIAKSQTGTGKTAAFGIPVCNQVVWEEHHPQALVLEPTRELADQVRKELFYIGRKKRLKVPAVFGGFPIEKQIQTLKQKNHIVIGTPGRVMDHIRRGSLNLTGIKYLVIDEADLMLSMGFLEDIEMIIEAVSRDRKLLLFSATMGPGVEQMIQKYMPEAKSIIIETETETVSAVSQDIYETTPEEKYDLLKQILVKENPTKGMIFCATREMVNVLYRKLRKDRVSCGMIHGELDQQERLKVIEGFREERFRYLLATDIAARGVDFDKITHIINYDFPMGKETFVHRTGRTGRNGASGKAISLVCEEEQRMKKMVEDYIGYELPVSSLSKISEKERQTFLATQKERINPKKRKGYLLNRDITKLSIGGGRKSKMRTVDIVGTICNIEGLTSADIGIIDIRDSITQVEILNGKGKIVLEALQDKPVKGKIRKVRTTRS